MHKKEKEFYDNCISELKEAAAEGRERIKVLEQALLEKDEAVNAIKKKTAKAKRMMNKKNRKFIKVSTENADLKAKIEPLTRREDMANELNERIRGLEVEEKTLQRFLEEKDKDIAQKNDALVQKDDKIEILKDSINRLELEKGELIKKVEKLEKLF
jgi:chromosome segregation ATPase|tara:strand:- start:273 stop:743 length:471 start_codon:yes stop_codon:yes gene_type:complete